MQSHDSIENPILRYWKGILSPNPKITIFKHALIQSRQLKNGFNRNRHSWHFFYNICYNCQAQNGRYVAVGNMWLTKFWNYKTSWCLGGCSKLQVTWISWARTVSILKISWATGVPMVRKFWFYDFQVLMNMWLLAQSSKGFSSNVIINWTVF